MSFLSDLQSSLGDAYHIERELGGGGMSRVFLAEERSLGRKVVVKILPEELSDRVSTQRFRREIALAARLHHPHIVPLLLAGETAGNGRGGGIVYYTMPFVDGETLRTRIDRGPMPVPDAVRVLRAVATAVAYAHVHHVVHRDIKPENVLLAGDVAAVADFGVAKALRSAAGEDARTISGVESTLTTLGIALGTPAYMAPEQVAADPAVDHRADIYSIGCVAYEMLSGAPPFTGGLQRMLASHVTEAPVPLLSRRPEVPADLAALVMRCLAKAPEERPQSADEIVAALDALTVHGSRPAHRRSGRRLAAALGVAIALAAAAIAPMIARRLATTPAVSGPRSVGVLPFDNLSADRENAYFAEGISGEIAATLGRLPGLRVAAERVPAGGQGETRDSRVIGRALGVETVLHGSVQRVGNRIRLTARLVNVADGYQIWSDRYDRDLSDVFAVQEELARAVVAGLRLRLAGDAATPLVRVATANSDAHALYLEGMYYWNRRTASSIRRAIELFRQATNKDPSYAAPYAGLGLAWAVLVDYEDVDVGAASDSAMAAGRAALARDSTSADGWAAIGEAHANRWENAAALEAFGRAVALDSNNARARQWYAEELAHVGRLDEARREIYRARDLEPLTLTINANVGRVENEARRYREAETALRHTLDLDSTFHAAHTLLSAVYLEEGRAAEAIAEYEATVRFRGLTTTTLAGLAHVYARVGRRADAERLLADVLRRAGREPVSHGALALVYDALGQRDRAIAELDSAARRFDATFKMRSREAAFDALRRDPRARPYFDSAERAR